jgi:hypothetical protein
MKVYRSFWLCVIGSTALLCMGVGFIVWPALGVIALFGVAALSAGAAIIGNQDRAGAEAATRTDRLRHTAPQASAIGIAVVAVFVLADTVGAATFAVLMLASATSPWVVKRVSRRIHHGATRGGRHTRRESDTAQPKLDTQVPPPLHDLSDRELCRLWRVTFANLQEASSTEVRERIVSLRQACIDELDRRNPGAMRAWFASNPRAASSPDKYLAQSSNEEQGDAA